MIDEKKLENMVREVLANMGKNESTEGAIKECSETEQCNLDVEDYPLATQ